MALGLPVVGTARRRHPRRRSSTASAGGWCRPTTRRRSPAALIELGRDPGCGAKLGEAAPAPRRGVLHGGGGRGDARRVRRPRPLAEARRVRRARSSWLAVVLAWAWRSPRPAPRARAGGAPRPLRPVHRRLHARASWSALAEQQGIGALLLAENYLLRVEYGLPPFRALTRVTREERSVLATRSSATSRAWPRCGGDCPHVLLIVPGVEVMPHYHWTGSPLALDMTVHNRRRTSSSSASPIPPRCARCPSPASRPRGHYACSRCSTRCPCCCSCPA